MDFETRWTVDGHDLTILELANLLKELIRMQHKKKWVVPDKPAVLVPQRKKFPSLAQKLGKLESWTRRQRKGKMQLRAGRV